jgi:hypothetical protein
MDTSLELIRAKIVELEAKLANLRIAERELQELERPQARKGKALSEPVGTSEAGTSDEPPQQQTLVAAITDILGQHAALSAATIADRIAATGREINNRAVSFSLQALKKRGLVKNTDGEWALTKARFRRAR